MVMNKSCQAPFYPQCLKPGDSIGVIAAGGRVDAEALEKGCSIISENGFLPLFSSSIYYKDGYFAGSDNQRAEALMEMFLDPNIKAVVCARGGYGSMRMAGLLDYALIAKNPKIFMGFSDATLLLSEITRKSGFVTWHGPMASTLANSDAFSIMSFFKVLKGSWDRVQKYDNLQSLLGEDSTEGFSICGNLTTFCHTAGTCFQADWSGKIVFLEEINEPLYKIDRMLVHMRLAGMFDCVKAIVIGDFTGCGPMDEIESLFKKEFSGTGATVFRASGFGHGNTNIPMPFCGKVRIDAPSGTLEWI